MSQESSHNAPEDLAEVMDYSSYDLRTCIRLIVLSGESRRINVRRGSRDGLIYIKDGEIYRAETDAAIGDEAFFEILAWDKAVHSDAPQAELPEPNMRISTGVFLDLLQK